MSMETHHPDSQNASAPEADPTLTRAFDLQLHQQSALPATARGPEWAGGWVLGLPPGISPAQWPLSPSNGHAMRHAFTLHLPPDYRKQGADRVAVSLFIEDQYEEIDACPEIEAFFTAPLSSNPPDNPDLHAFWLHRHAVHPAQHPMQDILGAHYVAVWLTQEEFDGTLCQPPRASSTLLGDAPSWMTEAYADYFPDTWLYTTDRDTALEGAEAGYVSGISTALPIRALPREGDPNVGKPPREWEHECAVSGYITAYGDEGTALDLGRWRPVAHLGGTMTPCQGYPEFGPYYLEFEEAFGGFNFGGGNAQMDLEKMALDWACG